ncbi:MAG: hypothetical protein KAU16_04415 [Methanophagales archaeon]|nr:hypothetical protein [Methanophagales archaeon]
MMDSKLEEADVFPVEKVSKIYVPDDISEETGIQGFVFSRKLLKVADPEKYTVPKTAKEKEIALKAAKLAWKIAAESDGGPAVGENSITIRISNAHRNAGSRAERIYMHFGGEHKFIRLWGPRDRDEHFPRGWTLNWDLNETRPADFLESIPTDAWDDILLINTHGDGILIDNIKIVHSDITIVDWPPSGQRVWLDGSKGEKYGIIGLADQIIEKKLEAIDPDIRWVPQLHCAVRELGKTDGTKYGTVHAWCSEFASWCLRKAGWWDAPKTRNTDDNFGSGDMEGYFNDKDRKYTKQDLLNGNYTLTAGDYLRMPNHSALFIRYVDDGRDVTDTNKEFISIEGNTGSKVAIRRGRANPDCPRYIDRLISVGSTR